MENLQIANPIVEQLVIDHLQTPTQVELRLRDARLFRYIASVTLRLGIMNKNEGYRPIGQF